MEEIKPHEPTQAELEASERLREQLAKKRLADPKNRRQRENLHKTTYRRAASMKVKR